MKLNEITYDNTGQLAVDLIHRAMQRGKNVWLDIDGDQGWEGITGQVKNMFITNGNNVEFETEDGNWWDVALHTFDSKYTLESRKGQLTLVRIA